MKPQKLDEDETVSCQIFATIPLRKAGSTTHCPKTTSAGHKPPKFNSLPVKNGGWKAILSYSRAEGNVFRGELAVKLRGDIWEKKPVGHFDGKTYMTLENHHFLNRDITLVIPLSFVSFQGWRKNRVVAKKHPEIWGKMGSRFDLRIFGPKGVEVSTTNQEIQIP